MLISVLVLSLLIITAAVAILYYLMKLIAWLTNRWIATLVPVGLSVYSLMSASMEVRRCSVEPLIVRDAAIFPPGCDGPSGAAAHMGIFILTPFFVLLMAVLVARLWSRKPTTAWWS